MPVTWTELSTVSPGDFTVLTVPDVLEDRGDAWADIDAEVGDVAGALALWQRDVEERGLGELNFPPDYPKMPGEPPRVQPSKRRTDKADAEYMAPKAERDAEERERWGMPVVPPVAADARQGGQGHRGPRGAGRQLRAEVGRLPLDRLPLRRPRRDRQPQREADDPLLPRGRRGGPGQPPRAVRRRRRDHRRAAGRGPARLRPAEPAHPPRRQPGEEAVGRDAGALRGLRPAGPRRRGPHRAAVPRAAGAARAGPGRRAGADPPHARDHRPRRRRRVVHRVRGRRASTAWSPSSSTGPTSPTSARWPRSSTSARPTASSRGTARTRAATT